MYVWFQNSPWMSSELCAQRLALDGIRKSFFTVCLTSQSRIRVLQVDGLGVRDVVVIRILVRCDRIARRCLVSTSWEVVDVCDSFCNFFINNRDTYSYLSLNNQQT